MPNPVDMDAVFGKPTPQQPSTGNQPSEGQQTQKMSMDDMFGKPGEAPPSSGKKTSPEDDEYEAKVQSLLPKAREYVGKESGAGGAFLEGVGKPAELLGLRTATRGAMAAFGAGEGKNFSERYNQLKAEDEAVSRAYDEKHGLAKGVGEFAGYAGAAYVAPSIAIPAEGALIARGVGPTAAKLLGMGAEGATWGAGTALGEKAFGTKSAKDEPGIGESAAIGGIGGAGLGAASKVAGKAYESFMPTALKPSTLYENYAPDFVKKMFGEGNATMNQIGGMIAKGEGSMSLPDFLAAQEEGKPVTLFHLVGPEDQKKLMEIFKGRPEAAKIIQDKLATWSSDAKTDMEDFARNLLGSHESPADMKETAQALSDSITDQRYDAIRTPGVKADSGATPWKPEWNKWLNSETFNKAIDNVIENLRETTGIRTGDRNNYVAPFEKIETTDTDRARAFADSFFKGKGVETPESINMLGDQGKPKSYYQLVNPDALDFHFVDLLQRELNSMSSPKLKAQNAPKGSVASEVMNARQQMMDAFTDPDSNLYNSTYAQALNAHADAQKLGNVFELGKKIWTTGKSADASEIAQQISRLSPQEKQYVAHGWMEEAIQRTNGDVRKLNDLLSNKYAKQAVIDSLGPNHYNELERFVRTRTAAANAIESASKLGLGSDYKMRSFFTNLVISVASQKAAIARLAWAWANDHIGEKAARNLAEKLSSSDPRILSQGLATIENNTENKRSFGQFLINHAPAIMGGLAGGHADGGAVQGYAFGGAPNNIRIANKSVVMPKPGDPEFVGPTMTASSYDPNKSHVFDKLNVMHRDNPIWTPDLGNVSARGYAVDKSGRSIMRSTGGRIPEADKLFKQAKKFVDSHTKNLLNVHDDDIVKALRVAAKRV